MADPVASQPTEGSTSTTVTLDTTESQVGQSAQIVHLKLRKPKTDRKVQWTTTTVDNEEMNRKKSKCCCVYRKPHSFDESSSSDSDEECDSCRGHVERRKKKENACALHANFTAAAPTTIAPSVVTTTIEEQPLGPEEVETMVESFMKHQKDLAKGSSSSK